MIEKETYECDGEDEDCNDEIERYEDTIQMTDGRIDVLHRRCQCETFTVDLPIVMLTNRIKTIPS